MVVLFPFATHFMNHFNSLLSSWLSVQLSSHLVSVASSLVTFVTHPESALLWQGLKRTEHLTNGIPKLTGMHRLWTYSPCTPTYYVLCNALQCRCHNFCPNLHWRHVEYTLSGPALSSRALWSYLNFYYYSWLAIRENCGSPLFKKQLAI